MFERFRELIHIMTTDVPEKSTIDKSGIMWTEIPPTRTDRILNLFGKETPSRGYVARRSEGMRGWCGTVGDQTESFDDSIENKE